VACSDTYTVSAGLLNSGVALTDPSLAAEITAMRNFVTVRHPLMWPEVGYPHRTLRPVALRIS
jgi:hypothetical protein